MKRNKTKKEKEGICVHGEAVYHGSVCVIGIESLSRVGVYQPRVKLAHVMQQIHSHFNTWSAVRQSCVSAKSVAFYLCSGLLFFIFLTIRV